MAKDNYHKSSGTVKTSLPTMLQNRANNFLALQRCQLLLKEAENLSSMLDKADGMLPLAVFVLASRWSGMFMVLGTKDD